MLTIIPTSNLEDLENQYPLLKDYERNYILYQNEKFSYLPRYFPNQFPYDGYIHFDDPSFVEQSIEIEGQVTPRDYQKPVLDFLIKKYEDEGQLTGIFEALVGWGKTVGATYLTATLKKKTLIVLDNSKLMQQWIDAYLQYTNLTEDDIGIIKGNRMDFDKPVTIAMVQTMMSRVKRDLKKYYPLFRDAGFGLVIYDEVHKTSSGPRYATSTLLLNTKNILGLSATPFAHDLHKILLYNSIGNVIYIAKDYQIKPKHVYFVKYDSGLRAKYYKKFKFLRDYIKSIAFYNSIIAENEYYLKVILTLVQQCVKVNHKVLIIVSTVQQVETIIKYLTDRHVVATPVYSKANEVIKGVDNVLVGTMKFASTGFDYSELSALILATPLKGKTSLIQSIGRIVRHHPGKNPPVVLDLMDQSFPHIFESNIGIKTKVISDEFKVESDAFKTIQFNIKPDNQDDDDI